MRIAVLTLPLHTNYGGILQAYALQKILTRMGHDVCHIEERHFPQKINPLLIIPKFFKRTIFKLFKDRKTRIFAERYYNKSFPIITQHTFDFVRKHICLRVVDSFSQIRECDYDAFVVGSDQVWRPHYYSKIEKMFLSFTKGWNVKRIAYAASFGSDVWEYSDRQTVLCGELLKIFDLVTVREQSGVSLIKKFFKQNSTHVLDPTMLLESSDYLELLAKMDFNANSESNVIMQYVLDEDNATCNLIADVASKNGFVVKRSNSRFEDFSAPIEERIQPPVEQWLKSFYESSFVVTDSFHATAFSILFHRPFYVFMNKERGTSRIESLLKTFGLENRIVESAEKMSTFDFNIDWTFVDMKLAEERERCKALLKNALKS